MTLRNTPQLYWRRRSAEMRARLNPAGSPRKTAVREVLPPSLGAHIQLFWSAAATKRARPRRWPPLRISGKRRGRARFVAVALQKNCIYAPKLGGRTSLTAVLRGPLAGLRRARSFSAAAPPVQLGGVAQGHTCGLIPFLSASNSKVRLFSKVFANPFSVWLVSVRSLRPLFFKKFRPRLFSSSPKIFSDCLCTPN